MTVKDDQTDIYCILSSSPFSEHLPFSFKNSLQSYLLTLLHVVLMELSSTIHSHYMSETQTVVFSSSTITTPPPLSPPPHHTKSFKDRHMTRGYKRLSYRNINDWTVFWGKRGNEGVISHRLGTDRTIFIWAPGSSQAWSETISWLYQSCELTSI